MFNVELSKSNLKCNTPPFTLKPPRKNKKILDKALKTVKMSVLGILVLCLLTTKLLALALSLTNCPNVATQIIFQV